MDERLLVRAGEYLLSRGTHFSHVTSIELDPQEGTLDIWYNTPDGRRDYLEMREVENFLTFMVTGGN